MQMQIVFQTTKPNRLADFWRTALHYVPEPPPDGFATWDDFASRTGVDLSDTDIDSAVDPAGNGPRLLFERIERPTSGNSIHLDINVATRAQPVDEARAAIDVEAVRLEALGASTTKTVHRGNQYWIEMIDPDGNWFCVQ